MNQLTNMDLHFVVSRIPKDIQNLIKENNLILGGGFIRSTVGHEKVSDLDLFGSNLDLIEKVAYKIAADRKARIYKTDNALTVLSPPRYPLQFIKRWLFNSPEEVIKSFDFTVCQAAVFFKDEKWSSVISEEFYPDLASKRLVYTCPVRDEAVGGSILRVLKYLKRDYCIQPDSFSKIIARLVHKVEGIDRMNEVTLGIILKSLLREVDPLLLVDGVDLVDEHQVDPDVEDNGE